MKSNCQSDFSYASNVNQISGLRHIHRRELELKTCGEQFIWLAGFAGSCHELGIEAFPPKEVNCNWTVRPHMLPRNHVRMKLYCVLSCNALTKELVNDTNGKAFFK